MNGKKNGVTKILHYVIKHYCTRSAYSHTITKVQGKDIQISDMFLNAAGARLWIAHHSSSGLERKVCDSSGSWAFATTFR